MNFLPGHVLGASGLGPFVLSGLVNGSIYGLVAVGLVLVYKLNGIFNFAQAEFASVAGCVALAFIDGLGPFPKLPYGLALVLGVAAGALTAFGLERLVVRPLRTAPRATLLVATAGVALLLIELQAVFLGLNVRVFPKIGGQSRFALFGSLHSTTAYVYGFTEIVVVVSLVAVALGTVGLFHTRYGAAIQATAEEPVGASLVGIDPGRISTLTWVVAGLVGGVAGIVDAPFAGSVFPGFVTGLYGVSPLVLGFIAAVVGGMSSLPGAFVGGILVGEIGALAGKVMPSSVPGGSSVVLGTLLLVVLLVRPTGLMGRTT